MLVECQVQRNGVSHHAGVLSLNDHCCMPSFTPRLNCTVTWCVWWWMEGGITLVWTTCWGESIVKSHSLTMTWKVSEGVAEDINMQWWCTTTVVCVYMCSMFTLVPKVRLYWVLLACTDSISFFDSGAVVVSIAIGTKHIKLTHKKSVHRCH